MSTTATHPSAGLFTSLADAARRHIIATLADGEASVTELTTLTGKRQQAMSHHLTILRLTGVVEYQRTGKTNRYRLTDKGLRALAILKGEGLA